MAFLRINNVKISGLSVAVPSYEEEISDIYQKWGDYYSFINTTGIERRRRASNELCSSDLCVAAAEQLIQKIGWRREDIDALVFVSQTPDYVLPATSCVIQNKLGLGSNCYTLDISLGCSGWVYALSVISSLMQGGGIKKGLLLAGDTILKLCSPLDKSTYPLFGDAGSATALEYDIAASPMDFCMYTDGAGAGAIIVKDGGFRNVAREDSFIMNGYGDGIERSNLNLELDGMSVFSFGISKAPKAVNDLMTRLNLNIDDIDWFTFHQANLFMNEKIRKKLKIPTEKVIYSLRNFANTSCASIPLTLLTEIGSKLESSRFKHIACGFGVGLSWASVCFETDYIVCTNLIEC